MFSVIGTADAFLEQNLQTFLQKQAQFTNFEFKILELNQDLSCQITPQISLNINANFKSGNIWLNATCPNPNWQTKLKAQVVLYQQVLIAKDNLKKGQKLTKQDFINAEIKFKAQNQNALKEFAFDLPQIAAKNINAGDILRPNMLQTELAIKKGQEVKALVLTENAQIMLNAIALTDGKYGGQVTLRNLGSQKIVKGEVIAPGFAQVL